MALSNAVTGMDYTVPRLFEAGIRTAPFAKLACRYGENDYGVSYMGEEIKTNSTYGSPPAFDLLTIGRAGSGGVSGGWIQNFSYYNLKLPDSALRAISR
jgi:hypothetical protein